MCSRIPALFVVLGEMDGLHGKQVVCAEINWCVQLLNDKKTKILFLLYSDSSNYTASEICIVNLLIKSCLWLKTSDFISLTTSEIMSNRVIIFCDLHFLKVLHILKTYTFKNYYSYLVYPFTLTVFNKDLQFWEFTLTMSYTFVKRC